MSLSIGIFGLPNVGKSTLFQALTKKKVDISNYPFCTVEPNVGIVQVPDKRLKKLAQITQPKKVLPSVIKFVDVAGLVRGAHKGEGLGNQFLAHLRECDALLQIIRCFKAEQIAHVDGEINPKRDIETIKSELIFKDLETIERRLQKIEKDVKAKKTGAEIEFEILNFLKEKLNQGKAVIAFLKDFEPEKKKFVEDLFLLTAKPQIYLLNSDEEEVPQDLKKELTKEGSDWLAMNLRDELDKTELSQDERKELALAEPKLDNLIKKCYEVLNLISFFTIVGKEETRAWPIEKGSTILQGAGKIHSDFQEKFVRGEVIAWQKLVEVGSWKKAGEQGLLKTVGKDYVLRDGDVIEIKI
ncbi:redox-regulated ATPase YchF [bacterium]|nr:redox-regulated ATPase YchF [bacterium]